MSDGILSRLRRKFSSRASGGSFNETGFGDRASQVKTSRRESICSRGGSVGGSSVVSNIDPNRLKKEKIELEKRAFLLKKDTEIYELDLEEAKKASGSGIAGILSIDGSTIAPPDEFKYESSMSEHVFPNNVRGNAMTSSRERIPQSHVKREAKTSRRFEDWVSESLVYSLARQNLPKIEPIKFDGDPLLFYSWRSTFYAAIEGAELSPMQEIAYLKQYSKGRVFDIINAFGNRRLPPNQILVKLWEELERRFGGSAVVANEYMTRLTKLVAFREGDREGVQKFADLCEEINLQMEVLPSLGSLNYPSTAYNVYSKLPRYIRDKWAKRVLQYSEKNSDNYPPFAIFTTFITDHARLLNHPNVAFNLGSNSVKKESAIIRVNKNEVLPNVADTSGKGRSSKGTVGPSGAGHQKHCVFHNSETHSLVDCDSFRNLGITEKRKIISDSGLCFICFGPHFARNCGANVSCDICSGKHYTTMHRHSESGEAESRPDRDENSDHIADTSTYCTKLCGKGKIACKVVQSKVIFPKGGTSREVFCLLDDQSNQSLISSDLVDYLMIDAPIIDYKINTCAGNEEPRRGRLVKGLNIVLRDGNIMALPPLLECDVIPQCEGEIPVPWLVEKHEHLRHIAHELPQVDESLGTHILFGRDCPEIVKVRNFLNGGAGSPWAQETILGWTVSGRLCPEVSTNSISVDCELGKGSSENSDEKAQNDATGLMSDVFHVSADSEDQGLSVNDRRFLALMNEEICVNNKGNWEVPLPILDVRKSLPDSRPAALTRYVALQNKFKRQPDLAAQYDKFMSTIIEQGQASIAPPLGRNDKYWVLSHFPVFNKSGSKIRVCFDAKAEVRGLSLNKCLMSGPDLMNSLFGILLNFRSEPIAFMSDVTSMFHCFYVADRFRNYQRFIWGDDGTHKGSPVEWQMNVLFFGATSSPAAAQFAFRKTAEVNKDRISKETYNFIRDKFFVDDGIASTRTTRQAVAILRSARDLLSEYNISLGKIVSNSREVLEAFPREAWSKDFQSLDLSTEVFPAQKSLGMGWDVSQDRFTFEIGTLSSQYTRRGVMSVVNSLWDPHGLVAPVTLVGKLILRELMEISKTEPGKLDWDSQLSPIMRDRWDKWKLGLKRLNLISVPRCHGAGNSVRGVRELHGFADASNTAIACCVYVKMITREGVITRLIYGQSKLAPKNTTSVPRLELCAAVLLARAVHKIRSVSDLKFDRVFYYSDNKAALGYIRNESKRFHVFVANRVQLIRNVSDPAYWAYVPSDLNPSDIASRGATVEELIASEWLDGPRFLMTHHESTPDEKSYPLEDDDPEIKVSVFRTKTTEDRSLGCRRFERFSSWISVQRGVATLLRLARRKKEVTIDEQGKCSIQGISESGLLILKAVQREHFRRALTGTPPRNIAKLNPFVDEDGLLRVGGRLDLSELTFLEKHPIIMPRKCHVSLLIARYFHDKVSHQGKMITLGAIRDGGFWILGVHRIVSKMINGCVICRKLRGKVVKTMMATLPASRTNRTSVFQVIGLDVFGPWEILLRRTRGIKTCNKRWALLLTDLYSRAVHIEVLDSMSADSFICALRRFIAIRGEISLIKCDRGTNFIGGSGQLTEEEVKMAIEGLGIKWEFNPPHASHFGGAWERQIRSIRNAFNAMITQFGNSQLTGELLSTFLAEACAIVNSRPIVPVSTDPEDPEVLSPATLLTGKMKPLERPPGTFVREDLFARHQWRRVQYLADQFWIKWRRLYLQNQQTRPKWNSPGETLGIGDVVLMIDETAPRYQWPVGVIVQKEVSHDNVVRKYEVRLSRNARTYLRPASQLVLLVTHEVTSRAEE